MDTRKSHRKYGKDQGETTDKLEQCHLEHIAYYAVIVFTELVGSKGTLSEASSSRKSSKITRSIDHQRCQAMGRDAALPANDV